MTKGKDEMPNENDRNENAQSETAGAGAAQTEEPTQKTTDVVVTDPDGNVTDVVSFTQEQVNSIAAKEKRQGRNSALNDLGISPEDEETTRLVRAFVESLSKGEDQTAAAQQRMEEANRRAESAEAKLELISAGVDPKYVDDAIALAQSHVKGDVTLQDAVKDLKTRYPVMFGDRGDQSKSSTAKKGTGASLKGMSGTTGGDESGSLGKRLAASRKSRSGKKSSFWAN